MGAVEAVYIFDEHNKQLLEHVYVGRPPPASTLLPLYLTAPPPRPAFTYLTTTHPSCLLFSHIQDRILFICPCSSDVEPLLVLEFLHRLADALTDFLGAPLLATKIDASYDVVAQVVNDMCDAGVVCNTELNALKESVEVPSWVGGLLGGFGLPASTPSVQRPGGGLSLSNADIGPAFASAGAHGTTSAVSSIPWRRANVRHTSNELYVDIVESLSVILAPSGRPISAVANGSIAFNSKISGVPDLTLVLTAPGGSAGIQHAMDLPCFHPCVRLARWRERPGELSFIPPDGRFVLAGYECNLLPDLFSSPSSLSTSIATNSNPYSSKSNLALPATVQVNTCAGANGDEIEVHLFISTRNLPGGESSGNGTAANSLRSLGPPSVATRSGFSTGSSSSTKPGVEDVVVTVPIPSTVRNVLELRATRGNAHFAPTDGFIEWRLSNREAAMAGLAPTGTPGATLRCSLVGPVVDVAANTDAGISLTNGLYDYDEQETSTKTGNGSTEAVVSGAAEHGANVQANPLAALMPRSASVSFSVRGWLASGLRVDRLNVDAKASRGLGAGVTPYKGVKYVTVSLEGVEARC